MSLNIKYMDYLELFAKLILFSGIATLITLNVTKISEGRIQSSFERNLKAPERNIHWKSHNFKVNWIQ